MSLRAPKLDDRSFHDLVAEAKRLIAERCPQWTDLSPGDPGTTLMEMYAFLTEVMLYRINRLPEKAYIEFLRLMGVKLVPPGAARVALTLTRNEGSQRRITVPRGTRVTVARSPEGEDPPIFTTAEAVVLEPENKSRTVLAYHCQLIEGELAGLSNGLPGQSFQLRQAPVVAPTGDELDLVVAVENDSELSERTPSLTHEDRTFRIWRETENFSHAKKGDHLYVADRYTGTLTFAPAVRLTDPNSENGLAKTPQALAATPPSGKRILVWYRSGGGPGGNVAAHALTVLKDPIAGLKVDNPEPAVGGCEAETLDNALQRGPQELHSLNRAVTARDYEAVALREGSVGAAHAVAQADRWQFAAPGTVQLQLVPGLPPAQQSAYTREQLESAQTDQALARVRQAIDERRPLGTTCVVDWYRYKPVQVHARLVLHPEETPQAVRERVITRLNNMINPLGSRVLRRRLHASDVYHTVLNEPGVLYADRVRFSVEYAPDGEVNTVTTDPFHPQLRYVATGGQVYRSLDNGTGWERLADFPGETVTHIACSHYQAGLLAAISAKATENGGPVSLVRLSHDCGQNWVSAHELAFEVNDAAWMRKGNDAVLLLATDKGLFQVPPNSGPVPVLVDERDQGLAFYAVTTSEAPRIGVQVAVATRNKKGVYLCADEQLERFHSIGLEGKDVRVMSVQQVGPRRFLWAGLAAVGGEDGDGCLRWELRRDLDSVEGWTTMANDWKGGSCRALTSHGEHVYAATFHSGVLYMDSARKEPRWQVPEIDCGLPLRDTERLLYKVNDVATARSPEAGARATESLLCGGPGGVFRSDDGGSRFHRVSAREFSDHITVGEGFLFCSGEHDIEATHDETP